MSPHTCFPCVRSIQAGKKSGKQALDAIVTRGNELLTRFERSYKK